MLSLRNMPFYVGLFTSSLLAGAPVAVLFFRRSLNSCCRQSAHVAGDFSRFQIAVACPFLVMSTVATSRKAKALDARFRVAFFGHVPVCAPVAASSAAG